MASDINFRELLREMKAKAGSIRRLADVIDVTEKTVSGWLNQDDSDLRVQPQNRDLVLAAARRLGVEVQHHVSGVTLWHLKESYEINVSSDPVIVPPPAILEQSPTKLLGRSVNSAFGASASVLTSTAHRVRFLAHAGTDVITYKTVRSRPYKAHPSPNIFCCIPLGSPLDPDAPVSTVKVDLPDIGPRSGMLNRFGMPSPPPEVWQCDFKAAKEALLPGQLLFLSVVGTADQDDEPKKLVDDFRRVANLAAAVKPDAIEVNASCPNCSGMEGLLFHNLELLDDVLRVVVDAAGDIPVVLKIGFAKRRELREIVVVAGTRGVAAIAAINTLPVEAVRDGQGVEPEPAFGKARLKAGLSGPPILRFGLRTVQDLVALREQENMKFDVIGGGGVSSPGDVETYLKSGANAVQATTVFFSDQYFGLKVRRVLVANRRAEERVAVTQRWSAMANLVAASEELSTELSQQELTTHALQAMLSWQADQLALLSAGPRLAHPVPSVADFAKKIRELVRRGR